MPNGIGYDIIKIERELFNTSNKNYRLASNRLDDIVNAVSKNIKSRDEPRKVLRTISDTLIELGYRYAADDSCNFQNSLIRKGLVCRDYLGVFLTLGENLGLPLYAAHVPHHIFVKWEDGNNKLNWETTTPLKIDGKQTIDSEVCDHIYIDRFKILPVSIEKGVYLKSLTINEFMAMPWNEWGLRFSNIGNYKKTIKCYDKASELNPKLPDVYTNKGFQLSTRKKVDHEMLLELYEKTLELDFLIVPALYNKARALSRLGRIQEAKVTVEKALSAIETRTLYYQGFGKKLEYMKKHFEEEHLGTKY